MNEKKERKASRRGNKKCLCGKDGEKMKYKTFYLQQL